MTSHRYLRSFGELDPVGGFPIEVNIVLIYDTFTAIIHAAGGITDRSMFGVQQHAVHRDRSTGSIQARVASPGCIAVQRHKTVTASLPVLQRQEAGKLLMAWMASGRWLAVVQILHRSLVHGCIGSRGRVRRAGRIGWTLCKLLGAVGDYAYTELP